MEFWDIYDADKKPTGRTMKRNDWCLKDGEYHLTVLGVVARPDNYFVDVYRLVMDVQDKDLELQTEETDGYMFATLDQIRAFAAEGKFLHYDSIKRAFEF